LILRVGVERHPVAQDALHRRLGEVATHTDADLLSEVLLPEADGNVEQLICQHDQRDHQQQFQSVLKRVGLSQQALHTGDSFVHDQWVHLGGKRAHEGEQQRAQNHPFVGFHIGQQVVEKVFERLVFSFALFHWQFDRYD